MKSLKVLLTGLVIGTIAVMPVKTALAATATANATATVVGAIAISTVNDLRFGNLAGSAALGTVVMTPASGRSATGGVTLSGVNVGGAASFTVSGDPLATYSITLPGAAATIISGANNMTVDTWTSTPTPTGALAAGGSQTLLVGGTLHVAASQASGSYTGTFDVIVAYN